MCYVFFQYRAAALVCICLKETVEMVQASAQYEHLDTLLWSISG